MNLDASRVVILHSNGCDDAQGGLVESLLLVEVHRGFGFPHENTFVVKFIETMTNSPKELHTTFGSRMWQPVIGVDDVDEGEGVFVEFGFELGRRITHVRARSYKVNFVSYRTNSFKWAHVGYAVF